jgi:hypothetical protein
MSIELLLLYENLLVRDAGVKPNSVAMRSIVSSYRLRIEK